MMLPLFVAYAAAFAAAAYTALRLGQSRLHTLALALLMFTVNLIMPATYAGLIGQIRPAGLLIMGVVWWGLQVVYVSRQSPLPEPRPPAGTLRPRLLRVTLLAITLVFVVFMVLLAWGVVFVNPNVSNSDAMWHYIPNAINIVQSGTLFEYNGISAYFPAAYEMLFAWEMTLTRTFHHVATLQTVIYTACILYALLILRLLMQGTARRTYALATCAALALLVSMYMLRRMLGETSKNDLYALLCGLAALYYWLCFWHSARDGRLIALVGLGAGLAVAAKLTALAWSLPLIGAHGLLLFTQLTGSYRLQTLRAHLLTGAAAVFLAVFPWGMRLLLFDDFGSRGEELVNAVGSQHTVLTNLSAAPFTALTAGWLPLAAGSVLGLALLLAPRLRFRFSRVVGTLLLAACLLALVFSPDFYIHFGGWYAAVALALLLIAAHVRRRERAAPPIVWIAALALAALALHSTFPYSAWIDYDLSGREVLYQEVNYRYIGAAFLSLWMAVTAVAAQRLWPAAAAPESAEPPRFRLPVMAAAALVILGTLAVISSSPRPLQQGMLALADARSGAATLDAWIDANIYSAAVYAVNAPPIALYGRALSNTVYYAVGGHSGYFGDQAYRWDDIERLIDTYSLDYIIMTGPYAGVVQGELEYTPDVRAEIERLRARLPVVYEDALFLILAVPHAEGTGTPSNPRALTARR
jgi:hypothetical protein